MDRLTVRRTGWLRSVWLPRFMAILVVATALGPGTRIANAWPAGSTASNTMGGFNYDTWEYVTFPYVVQSDIAYTKIWQGGYGYTRIDSLVHQTKTNSNWWAFASYLSGSISTTFYSDSYYLATFSNNLNGWYIGSNWYFWTCDSGTLDISVYGYGTGLFQGSVVIGGGGWGTVAGASASGSYNWSY